MPLKSPCTDGSWSLTKMHSIRIQCCRTSRVKLEEFVILAIEVPFLVGDNFNY